MKRAASAGIQLTRHDAAIVKGMISRGDRQHDIAAWFGVNGGRIAEISNDHNFSDVDAVYEDLPPPGPYLTGRRSTEAVQTLQDVKIKLETLLKVVEGTIDSMN